MKFIIYLVALIAGVSLSIEGAIYGELGKTIGKLESSFYNFFAGTIIIGLVWLFFAKGNMAYTVKAPKWTLLGGLLGTAYLTALVISIPLVGVGLSMITVIIGQMVMSMLIEHYGWLGSQPIRINKEKILAVVCMGLALVFIF